MNTFLNECAAWLSDFYLLSTILLTTVLVANQFIGQPARRIAISWSAAFGLLVLAVLCAAPNWSTVHMNRPAPLATAVVSLPSPAPLDFGVAEQVRMNFEPAAPEKFSEPTTVLAAKPIDWGKVALQLIAFGSTVMLLRLIGGAWQARRLRRRAVPASSTLTAMLSELTLGRKKTPQLAVLAELPVAVALGVRRPMILLPQSLANLSQPSKVRSVLAHELAHVQHRDLWFLALLRGLLVVLWAHPLIWIWRRQVRLDQETLADAAAAAIAGRSKYAEQLVALARMSQGNRLPRLASSVGLWENASQLKRRVAVLLDERLTVLRNCTRRWRFFSVLTLAVVTLGLSLVTLQPEKVATAEAPSTEEATFGTAMKLNNGATVSLLAIGTHGTNAERWWDAEGRALKKLPFKAIEANNISPQPNGQLVFRVQGHDKDSDIKWKTLPATNTGEGSVIVDGKKNPRGYFHHAFVLPENDGIFSLRVGVASGEWLTMAKGISGAQGRLGMSVVFSRAFSDNAGSAVVIVSLDAFNHREVASRCIAIDKKGKEHIATSHGGTSAGEQNQTQWTFKDLKPAEVEEFALQTRPYEWAEFGGLPAGQLSNPKVSTKSSSPIPKSLIAITSASDKQIDNLLPNQEMLALSIKVVDEEGKPVSGVNVTPWALRSSQGHGWWSKKKDSDKGPVAVMTDDDGLADVLYPKYRYLSEKVRTTGVSLWVDHPEYAYIDDLHINDIIKKEAPYKITIIRGVPLEIVPTIDGKPADLKNIYAAWSDGRSWLPEVELRRPAEGILRIPAMKPGPAGVRIVRMEDEKATHFSRILSVDLKPGEANRIDAPLHLAQTILGKFSDNVPRPVLNGRVKVWSLPPTTSDVVGWNTWAPVQQDGTFVIESWPDGEAIQLIALCDGFHATSGSAPKVVKNPRDPKTDPFTRPQVFEPTGSEPIVVSMTPLVKCVVEVVDQVGNPVSGLEVGSSPNVGWWNSGSQVYCSPLVRSERLLKVRSYEKAVDEVFPHLFSEKTDVTGRVTLQLPGGKEGIYINSDEYESPILLGTRRRKIHLVVGETKSVRLVVQPKGTEMLGDWDKLAGVIFGCSTREGQRVCALPGVTEKIESFRKRLTEAEDPFDPALLAEAYTAIAEILEKADDEKEAANWRRKAAVQKEKIE